MLPAGRLALDSTVKLAAKPVGAAIKVFRQWSVRRSERNVERATEKNLNQPAKGLRDRFFSSLQRVSKRLPQGEGVENASFMDNQRDQDFRAQEPNKLAGDSSLLVDGEGESNQLPDRNNNLYPRSETVYQRPSDNKAPSDPRITRDHHNRADADLKARHLEEKLAVGAIAVGAATGVAVGAASALQPEDTSRALFDHILQKDTPLDEMLVLGQHNALAIPGQGSLPFVATNQTLSIEETLEKTPVRAFELDLHSHNGDVVINHGGLFDPLVDDSNIPRLDDALNPIKDWLDKPSNGNEVVFLEFENKELLNGGELDAVLGDKVMYPHELAELSHELGRAPTINEITADGPRVIIIQGGDTHGAGHGSVDYYDGLSVESFWEDRTILGVAGPETHPQIAGQITAEDIDNWLQGGEGGFIKLDQISADDPRFYTQEDREGLALDPDLSILGAFYFSNEDAQSALLGIGTAGATATGALGLAAGVYQGVGNERRIRGQDRHVSEYLKDVELLALLQARKDRKKPLNAKITAEEIKALYVKQEKSGMTKNTLMPGISSTVSIAGSLLALGMIFPPVFVPLAIASAVSGVVGVFATLGAVFVNRRRLNKSIQKTFSHTDIEKKLAAIVSQLEVERQKMMANDSSDDKAQSESLLQKTLKQRTKRNRLTKASQLMLGGTLAARVSGLSKYGVPVLGTVAMGVGAAISGVLVALSAVMNFKDRRKKLKNLPEVVMETLQPDIDSKRFWLFGSTPYEQFVKKNWTELQREHSVFRYMSLKNAIKNYKRADLAPDSALAQAFLSCRQSCVHKRWEKSLKAFLVKQKPSQDFETVRKDPQALKACLKSFIIKRVGEFAHNDTFHSGRNNTLKLFLLSAFSGIFFFPMFGVAAGTLVTGLGVSKAVAVHERRLFENKLREAIDNPGTDLNQKKTHQMLSGLISAWADRFSLKS